MVATLWIALGGAVGSVLRFWVTEWITGYFGPHFPWGTIVANVTGCLAIGFFATIAVAEGRMMMDATVRDLLMIGLCGGYTTFSSFSLQTLMLIQNGEWARAGANIGFSVVLCLVAVWLGHLAGSAVQQFKPA